MILCLAEPISKRIDIAKQISNAEIKYRELSREELGSVAGSSSGKKPDPAREEEDDEKLATVMQGCIGPRLARLRTSYFGPHQQDPVSDWWGVNWLFVLWRGEPGVPIHRHECRITKIEAMLNLRISIVKRISNAEMKCRELSQEEFGSAAGSSSGKKPGPAQEEDDDEKLAKVMQECIAPRLARLRASYFDPHQQRPVSDWWGVTWLFALWGGKLDVSIDRHERRITNIEIMLKLLDNRDSLPPEFWKVTANSQLGGYQEGAMRILRSFERYISELESIEPSHRVYQSALAKAVERAQAEPSLNEATWADVFIIRYLWFDPTLKAVIDSEKWTPSEGRQAFMAVIDEVLLDQPYFSSNYLYINFSKLVAK
ncbi:hypothetical protein M407DRAFT_23262 [Tulasnella calospora MUT 4182]|uniref:Uncharacterized protein n=1 Tax=Tulasnella calospora MUT 4182 TaxID=1051891 RepID=A0A0C3QLN4_9AGAM|nr:hypothetical protein M407DRAFT_23262 [Tulasnella calospora MUT 4182]